jgi:hypothetical protein
MKLNISNLLMITLMFSKTFMRATIGLEKTTQIRTGKILKTFTNSVEV